MKYYGAIGFSSTENTAPGVYTEQIIEKELAGDITRVNKRYVDANSVNDNITLNMSLSIIADPFVYNNLGMIRYITYLGSKWKVTDISIQYPRVILSIGGLYE